MKTKHRKISELQEDEAQEKPLSMHLVLRLFISLGKYKWLVFLGNIFIFICIASEMTIIHKATGILNSEALYGQKILVIFLPLLFLALANRVFGWAQFMVTTYASNKAIENLRKSFFAKLQTLSKSFFDTHKAGWLVARSTGDMWYISEFMTYSLMMIVVFLTSVGYAIYRILNISPILIIPTLLIAPIVTGISHWYKRKMAREQRYVREQNSRMVANMTENVRGVKVVQAFSREEKNLENFNELNMINRDAEIRIARLDAIFMPSMDFLGILNTTIVVSFGAWLMGSKYGAAYSGSLTTANLAAYVLYSNAILWPLRMIVEMYSMALRAMAAAERIYEIIDMNPGVPDPENPVPIGNLRGDIAIRNASFQYDASEPWILRDFNLDIPAGQTVALVGETGAGKTTVSSLIARFYDVTSGEIYIDDHNIKEYRQEELHRNMAIVPQEGFLFSGSVLDNLRFRRPELTLEQVISIAKKLGTHESISKLSNGYYTEVREGGASVSEGQRQLISITRALIADPSILILDEPTSSLDVHTESILQKALEQLISNRTTVLIAHRLSTVRNADRIVVLDHGQIIETGTHSELLNLNRRYAALTRQSNAYATFNEPAGDE